MAYRGGSNLGFRLGWVAKTLIALVVIGAITVGLLGYFFHGVGSNEVAVRLFRNSVIGVVGPGIYDDWRPFADIKNIKTEGLGYCVVDPEVLIQKAEQRIGVMVCGRIRRPGVGFDYASNWAQYRSLYEDDRSLFVPHPITPTLATGGVVFEVASQAMKVCVGDRNFEQSVVGSARDDLRVCIDEEMSELAETYGGLIVDNVTVPNVGLSPAAQVKMDQITDSKLAADLSRKEADKAVADGELELAREQAAIKVIQGKIQEDQRQKAVTADLERLALEAEMAVIKARKDNELAGAQQDLDVQVARRLAAEQEAQVVNAKLRDEAEIYSSNPVYASMVVSRAYAEAYKLGDKMVLAEGMDIRVLLGGQAVMQTMSMDRTPVPQ